MYETVVHVGHNVAFVYSLKLR